MFLTPRKEWSIYDSSKLDVYIACPRRFFYEHILGWRLDVPSHDLYFGQAWHIAREHQLLYGYDKVEEAFVKFLAYYRLKFDESTDEMYTPKNPMGVICALIKYAEEKANDLQEAEVIELYGVKLTEIAGTVPIAENRVLHYKMDSIMRRINTPETRVVFSKDHKSTTEKSMNYPSWQSQFYLSIQNGTYTHCLYCMFSIEEVLGVEFEGTGFTYLQRGSANRKAGYHSTIRSVPAFKTPEQMNVWLWNVNRIVDELEYDMLSLERCSPDDPVLNSFRMNPKSCGDYRGCPFHDFCLAWTNPLRQCEHPPLGFREEFWDPSVAECKIKQDLSFPQGEIR